MLFSSLLGPLTQGTKPNLKGRPCRGVSPSRKDSFRPTVEALEHRDLPSAGFLNPHFGTGGKTLINFGADSLADTFGFPSPSFAATPAGMTVLAGSIDNRGFGQKLFGVAELTKNGSLNPDFGTGGKTIISVPGIRIDLPGVTNIAVQPDGTIILVAGATDQFTTKEYVVVAELNKDGSLKHSFGNGDETVVALPNVGQNGAGVTNFVVATDGKIVLFADVALAPTSNVTNDEFMVAELTKDGSLNTNFGTGGETIIEQNVFGGNTRFHVGNFGPYGFSPLAITSDGTIVLTGDVNQNTFPSPIGVVELTKDGSLNNRFGQGGKVLVSSGPNLVDFLTNFVVNEDDTILLGDTPANSSDFTIGYFAVIKLNKDGSLDANFGVGGKTLIFGPTASYNFAYMDSFAVGPNGTIVVGGTVTNISTGQNELAVAELTRGGRLNADFGVGGETIADFGPNYSIPAGFAPAPTAPNFSPTASLGNIVVQPNGTIVLAVPITNNSTGQSDYGVAELTKDGKLNPEFGTGGETIVDFGAGNSAQLNYAIVKPDSTIVLAGFLIGTSQFPISGWAVAELTAPLPKVKVNSTAQLEGESGLTPFTFQVKLPSGGSAHGPATYDVYTTDGTAKARVNYVGITAGDAAHGGTVTFAQGSNYATATVYVIAGSIPVTPATASETFTVNISDPANPGVPLASGTGTIIAQMAEAPASFGPEALNQLFAELGFKKSQDW